MSFQPPPPSVPPPPPGATPAGFDPKSVNVFDWVIIGIGAFLFIFSFFGYYTFSYFGYSESFSGWHTGGGTFPGMLAFIVGIAAAVIVALGIFLPSFKLPVPSYVAAFGLFALSFLLYLLGFVTADIDAGFSYYLSLVAVIAGAVVSLIRAQQTNTALPGPLAGIPKILK